MIRRLLPLALALALPAHAFDWREVLTTTEGVTWSIRTGTAALEPLQGAQHIAAVFLRQQDGDELLFKLAVKPEACKAPRGTLLLLALDGRLEAMAAFSAEEVSTPAALARVLCIQHAGRKA